MSKLLRNLTNLPRSIKAVSFIFLDAVILFIALLLAFAVRFDLNSLEIVFFQNLYSALILVGIQLGALFFSGLYRSVLRHAGAEMLGLLLRSIILGVGLFTMLFMMMEDYRIPRSILIMSATFGFLGLLSTRLMIRWVVRLHLVEPKEKTREKVVIYGAGSAGLQLFDSLKQENHFQIVGFIDDNPKLQGGRVRDLPISPFKHIQKLNERTPVDWILLALPSLSHEHRKAILEKIRKIKVGVRVLPTTNQLIRGVATSNQLQEVDVADLLGRDEIEPDEALLHQDILGKHVLVTGAGGSIGSALCKEILKQSPKKLVLLELNEFALYQAERIFRQLTNIPIVACLGNVQDAVRVNKLLNKHHIQTVYHAAAYKHVPMVEDNPIEGLRNNAMGTKILLEECMSNKVEAFVLISTDKAVRPTNVMGTSKRIAEMVVQDAARRYSDRKLAIVRFGNVLNSSGSVVPLFREQIAKRQPVTVTHKEITRYFMSIEEAVRLVIQAGAMATGGEVFLLDMGEPVRIRDLAIQMIELSGLVPEKDIPVHFTGLRPGEKLYEELLIDPVQSQSTVHPRIFCSDEPLPETTTLHMALENLFDSLQQQDFSASFTAMQLLVPEYGPEAQSAMLHTQSQNDELNKNNMLLN